MNICIFCHDAYMSGANKSLYDWISSDKVDRFVIVLPHLNSNQDFSKLANCKVVTGNYFCLHHDLGSKPLIYWIKKYLKTVYMVLFEKIIKKRLEKIVLENNSDLIISNSFSVIYGAITAKKVNLPHFWHIREFMELDHQISHKNPILIKDLAAYSNAIFISDVVEEYYRGKYGFKNSTIIYNQIKIDKNFSYDKQLFKNDIIHIIMSGTLQENKGQKEAISAVLKLLNKGIAVTFDIYGNGPQKEELNSIIQSSGYSNFISLKGYCDNLETIRKNYDIALICSSNEALGRVTIESMGSGCITIGADAGFTSEILRNNNNGFLYRLHDVDDLANKILYTYENSTRMKKIRITARHYAEEKFSSPIYLKIRNYINNV